MKINTGPHGIALQNYLKGIKFNNPVTKEKFFRVIDTNVDKKNIIDKEESARALTLLKIYNHPNVKVLTEKEVKALEVNKYKMGHHLKYNTEFEIGPFKITYRAGTKVYVDHTNNIIIVGTLAKDTEEIWGVSYKGGTSLGMEVLHFGTLSRISTFHVVSQGTLARNTKLKNDFYNVNITFKANTKLVFSLGKLMSGILAYDTDIQGRIYPAGSKLSFYSNGSLESVILARNTKIKEKPIKKIIKNRAHIFKAGSEIHFDENGNLLDKKTY